MRRIPTIAAVAATVGLLTATFSPALGQEEAEATIDHPIVGSWIADDTPDDPVGPTQLVSFNPGGSLVSVAIEGTGLGTWVPTGERTADLTFNGPVVLPETGFVGFVTIRASLEVSEDGQTFSGTYSQEFPGTMAEALGLPTGELGPSEATGQRIAVEPMGEPVGPAPDFSEITSGERTSPQPQASPEA